MKKFKFIDLFSGIGGFHQAMENLGGECVFASDIDKYAIETYKDNYGIDSDINVRDIKEEDIPKHDVLCAGFPCQTFSKAGKRMGFQDETKGTLFFEIERILKYHKTKYIILENVRNLVSHDHGNTWKTIYTHLKELGYRLTPRPLILSPHQLGVPQLRERVVILGIYDPENSDKDLVFNFNALEKLKTKEDNNIYDIIETGKVEEKYYITEREKYILTAWDNFYKGILKNYSVKLADTKKIKNNNSTDVYSNIFETLEEYVSRILPLKLQDDKNNIHEKIETDLQRLEQRINIKRCLLEGRSDCM